MPPASRVYDADAIQALHELQQYLERKSETSQSLLPATAPSTPRELEKFIPNGTIEAYLQERSQNYPRLRKILREVFELSPDTAAPPVSAKDLAEQCCRVFCILIRIGKSQYVGQFVRSRELWDECLPFPPLHPPATFPRDHAGNLFYAEFVAEQYRFCAENLIVFSNRTIDDNRLLPIVWRTQIGKGGYSRVNKVEIPQTHNDLPHHSTTSPHVYAIKTIRGTKHSQSNYENEVKAFGHVTEAGSKDTRGLIHFYGGFIYRGTFNLVLEYAEGGTLEEYFGRNNRPSTEEILPLWSSFFEVFRGLLTIHEKHIDGNGTVGNNVGGVFVQGWHQDLTPSNILLVRNPPGSDFPYTFKIADLGLCHFKTIMTGASQAIDWDKFGTRAYGAPECYRRTYFAEYRQNLISPKVDIWSLGCITCELAVWLVREISGLNEFRAARKSAIDSLRDFRIGDCFHDGTRLLDIIDQEIRSLRGSIWYRDWTTARVLELLPAMLNADPKARSTAENLEYTSEQIVKAANDLSRQQGPITPTTSPSRHEADWGIGPLVHTPSPSREPTVSPSERSARLGSRSGRTSTQGTSHVPKAHGASEGERNSSSTSAGQADIEDQIGRLSVSSPRFSDPESRQSASAPRGFTQQNRQAVQHLSRSVVHEWHTKCKYNKKEAVLEHYRFLMQQLQGRDHVLIIDDSKTMREHWDDVSELAKHLAYITKEADPDGLELYFLSDGKLHKCRNSSAVREKMRDHRCSGQTSLDGIFDSDLRKFARAVNANRVYNQTHLRKRSDQRPRSIYVLTDGKLELGPDSQGREAIAVLARNLVDADMPKTRFAIQFIRFGADEQGKQRLEQLDQLKDSGLAALDLVDTEPSNGNVVKMLIGAIQPLFDQQNERH